jgi:hypothetical protein
VSGLRRPDDLRKRIGMNGSGMNYKWLLALFFVAGAVALPTMAQDHARLSGRAVDKKGNPIAGAQVSLIYDACDACIDQIIPVISTNTDGVFFFLEHHGIKSGRVFVEGVVPKGAWTPLNASDLSFTDKLRFHGVPVVFSESESISLGDIAPTVFYKRTKIELRKLFSINLKTSQSLEDLTVKIADREGNLGIEKKVPRTYVDKELILDIALPQGMWDLTFSARINSQMVSSRVTENNE